ncbi:MAG: hypothetical protein HRU20_06175 [Pseudomonadales bacterium]|nr:hypothetical protein [Pseudomonadales bacterium]
MHGYISAIRFNNYRRLLLHVHELDFKSAANYSYVEQRTWQLSQGLNRSGVSYSDYQQDIGNGLQTGEGNDLNNWPNQAIKLVFRYAFNHSLTLHSDARVFWNFQGSQDGLSGL